MALVITVSLQSLNSDIYTVLLQHTINPFFHLLHITFFVFVFYSIIRYFISYFLDALSANEQSLINDNLFIFLTDTLLILSIFSEEISISSLSLFIILVIIKCLAWLISERVSRQKDKNIRIFISLILLPTICCLINNLYFSYTIKSLYFLFSFEYAIITLLLIKSLILTFINDPDHIFYTDIFYTTFKLISLVSFFILTTLNYRIPFNIFRESVSTLRQLLKKISNFLSYKKILTIIMKCEKVTEGMCPICAEDFSDNPESDEELENVATSKELIERLVQKKENISTKTVKQKIHEKKGGLSKDFIEQKDIDEFKDITDDEADSDKNMSEQQSKQENLNEIENISGDSSFEEQKTSSRKPENISDDRKATENSPNNEGVNNEKDVQSTNPGIKLPCSHTFHLFCLRRWVEQQQVCPVCRKSILKTEPISNLYNTPNNIMDQINEEIQDGITEVLVEEDL